jgi:predicted nuclease of restriction endonuclease-like (RecB) superfamily
MAGELAHYSELLSDVKDRIREAQTRAILAVNAELVRLYWDIGRLIGQRQAEEGWGAAVIPRLSRDLHKEMPGLKGFSERNLQLMVQFSQEYPNAFDAASRIAQPRVARLPNAEIARAIDSESSAETIAQPPVAQFPTPHNVDMPVTQLTWAHNILLIRVKDRPTRLWYMQQTLANGWSRDALAIQIQSAAHQRHGRAVSNFARVLPSPQSDLAQQALKDPYIFDFLTLEEPFHERELETALIRHLEKFLLELGQGFAFVGRQYRLEVGNEDFYIDLLFYHLKLRAFVVIDLKKGAFKPEYAGKINFYCNVVNDRLRHPTDAATIGLILCQTKDNVLAEYALAGIDKPIGIAGYELTRALPAEFASCLPSIEEIESELSRDLGKEDGR